MQVSQDNSSAAYVIKGYLPGKITVNQTIYEQSIIVTPDKIIEDWRPQSAQELTAEDLEPIIDLNPGIVIVGTGEFPVFLDKSLFTLLVKKHIGFEVMDTAAACRTCAVLLSEGRNFVAALMA